MRKLFSAVLVAGALFVAALTVAQAVAQAQAASCVNTPFSLVFMPVSWTSHLLQVKC